jgi:hypothetical protein
MTDDLDVPLFVAQFDRYPHVLSPQEANLLLHACSNIVGEVLECLANDEHVLARG